MYRTKILHIIRYIAKNFPALIPIIPFKSIRQRLSIISAKSNGNHSKVVELASKSLSRYARPKACLSIVKSANKIEQYSFSKTLLQETEKNASTNVLILCALSHEHLFSGDLDKALAYASKALILSPKSQKATLAYLTAKDAKGIKAYDEDIILLKNHKNSKPIVSAVCKRCKSKKMLNTIFEALSINRQLRGQHVHAFANAAYQVGEYDLARKHLMPSLQRAVENSELRKSKLNKVEDRGTKTLLDMASVLGQPSIPFFAADNTALGIMRDGKLQNHDRNINFGIMDEHWNLKEIVNAINNSPLFKIAKINSRKTHITAKHRNGIELNLFQYYRVKRTLFHDGEFVRWKHNSFKLAPREVGGDRVYIPADEKYYENSYGDWQTPDPSFDASIHAPNKQIESKEHYSAYIIQATNIALRCRDIKKAINLMEFAITGNHLNSDEKKLFETFITTLEEQQSV